MADAIYGGATIEATQNDMVRQLQSTMKGYQRQLSHDGVYAVATLMANDDSQQDDPGQEDGEEGTLEKTEQPRKCYIFCPAVRFNAASVPSVRIMPTLVSVSAASERDMVLVARSMIHIIRDRFRSGIRWSRYTSIFI